MKQKSPHSNKRVSSPTEPRITFLIGLNQDGPGWLAFLVNEQNRALDRLVYVWGQEGPRDGGTVWQMLEAALADNYLSAPDDRTFATTVPTVPVPQWNCNFYALKQPVAAFAAGCRAVQGHSPEAISRCREARIMASLEAKVAAQSSRQPPRKKKPAPARTDRAAN